MTRMLSTAMAALALALATVSAPAPAFAGDDLRPAAQSDECLMIELKDVPDGIIHFVAYNIDGAQEACDATLCTGCNPTHPKLGPGDLVASIPVSDGWVKLPRSWFSVEKKSEGWLCDPRSGVSMTNWFHPEHIAYLLEHGSTPAGDPASLALSRGVYIK